MGILQNSSEQYTIKIAEQKCLNIPKFEHLRE